MNDVLQKYLKELRASLIDVANDLVESENDKIKFNRALLNLGCMGQSLDQTIDNLDTNLESEDDEQEDETLDESLKDRLKDFLKYVELIEKRRG